MTLIQPLIDRLLEARGESAAWGYHAHGDDWAEPTAWAATALAAHGQAAEPIAAALEWLSDLQRSDGAVPVSAKMDEPHWPTAPALLAWQNAPPELRDRFQANIDRAQRWLMAAEGNSVSRNDAVQGHNSTLIGWSWVSGTHSWIEPTSYALLALRTLGQAASPRAREGVRLILDRALPDGGWNYGNRRVLEHVLRPFPATTGVALAALAREPRSPEIDGAIDYLKRELECIRAPLSLAWGLIGLRAWHAMPPEAESWWNATAERLLSQPANPHYDALMLLAIAPECPLLTHGKDAEHA